MRDLTKERVDIDTIVDHGSSHHVGSSEGENAAGTYRPSELAGGVPYWRSKLFLGSLNAIGFGVLACYAGFAMPANTLALINENIGMSHYHSDATLKHGS